MEMFAVRTEHWSLSYVPSDLAHWSYLCINRLPLVPFPPVFSCYRNLFFNKAYDRLLLIVARCEFGACTALQFLCVAVAVLTDTFKVDSSFETNVSYFVVLSNPVIALIVEIELCNIILYFYSAFDLASRLMAWKAMRCINWLPDYTVHKIWLFPYIIVRGVVYPFSTEGSARVMSGTRKIRVPQPVFERLP